MSNSPHLSTITSSHSFRYSLTPALTRSPLSERSDSDINKIAPPRYDGRTASAAKGKASFSRQPSPMASARHVQYIFEDDTAGPSENLTVPSERALRPQRSSGNSSLRGPRPQPSSEKFLDIYIPPLFASPNLSDSISSSTSAPHLPKIRELRPSGELDREVEPLRYDTLPLPPRQLLEKASEASLASSASSETFPLDQIRTISREASFGRPRSHTVNSKGSKLVVGDWPQFDTASSIGAQDERRRSSSSPEAPSGALLQALKASGTQMQYAQLHQASNSSLRANVTGAKPLYSAPLRIRKKRAISHLSREASLVNDLQPEQSHTLDSTSSAAVPTSVRADQSFISSEASYTHASGQSDFGENWRLERDDNISELRAPPLRHQRSARQLESLPEPRPASARSASSQVGSLYSFLNDSVNTWARFYYRGEADLSQESPPVETAQVSLPTKPQPLMKTLPLIKPSAIPKRLSAAPSGRSDSPGSVGFPDSLYIPRSRALRKQQNPRQESNFVIHEGSSFSESLRVGSTIGSPAPEEDVDVIEPIRVTSNTEVVPHSDQRASTLRWSGMFNPTPVLPHLTVDKHMSATLPNWRTPSFDEAEGIWSRQNRQILLFCIGFVFPFAWITAAFLPLPTRPQWRRKTEAEHVPEEETSVDLFNSLEVIKWQKARWWRNLNRFMSVAGVFIIAAVIACAVVATHARASR